MSTQTTPGGPVLNIAPLRIPVVPDSDAHAHNAQHAQIVHAHADVPEDFGAKNIQVSQSGIFDDLLPAGLVTEYSTVTEVLDVIDDAYIRVQPDTNIHETSGRLRPR